MDLKTSYFGMIFDIFITIIWRVYYVVTRKKTSEEI